MTDHLKRIARELRKLEATTAARPIARRNARRRVLSAMRTLRKAIDTEYPAIVDRTGVTRADPQTRIKRLKKSGWREVAADVAGFFASYGVTVRRVAWKTKESSQGPAQYVNGVGWKQGKKYVNIEEQEVLFVPAWAVAIGNNPTEIRRALASVKARRSAVVAEALT